MDVLGFEMQQKHCLLSNLMATYCTAAPKMLTAGGDTLQGNQILVLSVTAG
jgi:hypothetical protein